MKAEQKIQFLEQLDSQLSDLESEIFRARDNEMKKHWYEKKMEILRIKADFINGFRVTKPKKVSG
jgi:hypothetical protein